MHQSIPQNPSHVKTFFACLLSFMLFITPITALAATAGNTPTARKNKAQLAESELFVNQPVEMPAVPAAQPLPAPEPPAPLAPVGAVTATKSAALTVTANNGDGKADPGDTINYTVQLSNTSGSDGTGITFSDTLDTHTTLSGTVNSTPVAFDQTGVATVVTNEDTGVSITIQGQDPDGTNLTFTNISSPANGALGVFSAPSCVSGICSSTATYTPNANFFGSDSFTFKVNDGTSPSNETGSVSITVNGVNDAPTFAVPGNPTATNEDAGAISVASFITAVRPAQSGNTTEDTTQAVSFVITNNTNPGLFSSGPALNVAAPTGPFPTTATLTYTSALNQNGTAVITYHAHDNGGTANSGVDNSADQTFTITVNAVNDPPVVVGPGAFTAQANMKRTGLTGLLGNVNDNADNGVNGCVSTTFTVTNVSATSPAGGTISNLNTSTGTFDFDPPAGVTGAVTFTYTVTDTGCGSGTPATSTPVTVTFNVAGPVIWFVNLGAASNGDGRLSNPFNLLSSANTKLQALGANERIFLYSTTATTTAAINDVANLQSTQGLIGQGAIAADFDTLFGITPPSGTLTRPSINGTRPTVRGTVTMRNNTVVLGVNIDVSAASAGSKGIASVFTSGTSTVSDVNVTSTTGNAVDFSGTQTVTYTTSNASTSPNVIVSTTGIALNVVNTTIGASGLTFRSITVTGNNTLPSSGIILNNTGSTGGLKVSGNGGSCTPATPTCTGGTIQGTGSHGISMTGVSNIEFNLMSIHNTGDHGIFGDGVNNLTFRDSRIFNFGNAAGAAVSEDGMHFESTNTANTAAGHGLTGTVIIQRDNIGPDSASFTRTPNPPIPENKGIVIRNHNDVNLTMTVTGTKFTQISNDGIDADIRNESDATAGHGTATLNVDGSTADGTNTFDNINGRSINFVQPVDSAAARIFELTIKNNTFNSVGIGGRWMASGRGTMNARYNNNTMTNTSDDSIRSESDAVNGALTPHATVNATVSNNTMGGGSIFISLHRQALSSITFTSNTNLGGTAAGAGGCATCTGVHTGINLRSDRGSALGIDFQSNTGIADGSLAFAQSALDMQATTNGGGNSSICANIGGAGALKNTLTQSPDTAGQQVISIDPVGGSTITIEGGPGGSPGTENFLIANNTLNGTNKVAISTPAAVPSGVGSNCVTSVLVQNTATPQRDYLARTDQVFKNSGGDSSAFSFLNTNTRFRTVFEHVNRFTQSVPVVNETLLSQIVARAEGIAQKSEIRSQKSEVRERQTTNSKQQTALYARAAAPNTSVNNRGEVKLNHARSVRRKQTSSAAMAPVFAPVPPLPGTITINGVGSGFKLPNGKTITITFSVTLNNPPNLSGVPPATPQVSNQGTLSGGFIGNSIVTDDPSTGAANDATVTLVDLFNSTTTLGSSPTPPWNTGQSVTFTATVASNPPGNPTAVSGTVAFKDGVNTISGCGSVAVAAGQAQCTTTFTTGAHSITAAYSGDGNFDPSTSSAIADSAALSGTTTAVTSSQNPSLVGQNVTFTATVTSTTSNTGPPTGTVVFKADTVAISCTNAGGQTLSAGVATCQTATLTAAGSPHTITAEYPGDSQFNSSNGTLAGGQIVNKSGTTTALGSSANPAAPTVTVTYTATVTSSTAITGPPTGTVTFKDGVTAIVCENAGGQTLNGSGVATCNFTYPDTVGSPHSITGVYSGDGTFAASDNTGSPLIQVISSSLSVIVNDAGDAADINVGDNICDSDAGTAGNQCTLRAAIQETNAAPSADSIGFDAALNGSTITLNTALPAIAGNLTMTGPGAANLTVARSSVGGTPDFRIFTINSGLTVSITGLTLTNGKAADGAAGGGVGANGDAGGGIHNSGTLTLTDISLTNSRAGRGGDGSSIPGNGGLGGGIYTDGTLTMTNCVVSGNTGGTGGDGGNSGGARGGDGGGLYVFGGTATLRNVTISNNSAGNSGNPTNTFGGMGGGIFVRNTTTVTLTNSTLSGNTSGTSSGTDGFGGGVMNNGVLTLTSCAVTSNSSEGPGGGLMNQGSGSLTVRNTTISGNTALGSGHGVFNDSLTTLTLSSCTITNNSPTSTSGVGVSTTNGGPAQVVNTIIAGNGGSLGSDVSGNFTSQGNNLIGKSDGTNGFTNGVNGDQVGSLGSPINALLGPLANNGGPTLTHALLSGSPALDAGNNANLPADTLDLDGDLNTAEPIPFDQRGTGFARVVDGPDADATATVDIGAFEAQVSVEDIADRFINEDGSDSFSFGVGGGAAITSVTATSSNTTLVPNNIANLNVTGSGSTRTLTINPVADLFGTTTITVTVNTAGGSAQDTFVLTVNSVNDTPSFIKGPDQNVAEDAGAQSVANWATAISAGPANESGQTLTFLVTNNTNSALFSVQPAVSSTGTLTYTPAANTSGTAAITIVLMDNGGGADTSAPQTFNITVNSTNDPPVNTVPGAQSVTENSTLTFSAANSNAISIADVDAGTNPVQVQLTATNGVITLSGISGLSFTVGDGTADATMTFTGTIANINAALNGLVFTPTAGFSGAAALQIVTNDQGNTGSGGPLSDSDTINITVNDGGTLQFSSATYNVSENVGNATITITRTGGTAGTATVVFSTSNGTATAGSDYTAVTNQTVTFNAGDTSKTVSIPITNDALDENDETVNLTLTTAGGSGALGSPAAAVLTINDDDPTPSLSINDVSLAEGNSGTTTFTFTVTLSAASALPVTVNYATANGTADASDYTAVPSTLLTFNPGDTSKTVDVLVNGDILSEGNETFFVNLSSPTNATIADNQGLGTIVDDDAIGGTILFSSATYTVAEDAGSIQITVNRVGNSTQAVSVDYATSDMTATERSDYTTALGTLKFAAGETSRTFTVLVNQDAFTEGSELLGLTLSNASAGANLGVPQNATLQINDVLWVGPPANPLDDAGFFVRQHYHDFLNREPDASGLAFWTDQITGCGSDAACIELKRINVSAAFFLSIEFQETGFNAYLTNKAAFGSPLPRYRDFVRDTQALGRDFIFGAPGADAVIEANKVAFFNDFVNRSDFVAIYGALANGAYVDALIANTGVTFTTAERDALVNGLNAATETRATVLRKIAEKASFKAAEFNRAFVMMEYFGYLRRNPDDAPDNNLDGFNFWLNKLNQFNGNFINADMVKAFLVSGEYRQRFAN